MLDTASLRYLRCILGGYWVHHDSSTSLRLQLVALGVTERARVPGFDCTLQSRQRQEYSTSPSTKDPPHIAETFARQDRRSRRMSRWRFSCKSRHSWHIQICVPYCQSWYRRAVAIGVLEEESFYAAEDFEQVLYLVLCIWSLASLSW